MCYSERQRCLSHHPARVKRKEAMQHLTDTGPFSIVPNWVIEHPDITYRELGVYLILAKYADNSTSDCFPSHQTIAELAGCSKDTVKRALNKLRNVGAIEWNHQNRNDDGGQSSNVYFLKRVKPPSAYSATPSASVHPGGSASVHPGGGAYSATNYTHKELDLNVTSTAKKEQELVIPSALDWDDGEETRKAMSERIAKGFYTACREQRVKRPAVKHKAFVALIDDLIERGYNEEEICDLFSDHYRNGGPWTLNGIAVTESRLSKPTSSVQEEFGLTDEEYEEYIALEKAGGVLGQVLDKGYVEY